MHAQFHVHWLNIYKTQFLNSVRMYKLLQILLLIVSKVNVPIVSERLIHSLHRSQYMIERPYWR